MNTQKMESPLQLNREQLANFSEYLSLPNTPSNVKQRRKIVCAIVFSDFILAFVATVVFIVKNFQTDLSEAVYSIFQAACLLNLILSVIITWLYPECVCDFFAMLEYIRSNGELT